jgi:hypothetical protein
METTEILKKLCEDLPKEAVQKTKGSVTKKGYDTTGYGYQWIVDRLNSVLNCTWGFDWDIIHHSEGQFSSGGVFHEITVKVGIWITDKSNVRYCAGGHVARLHGDALKGAITNGIKKTAAFWGIGADAFRGEIDDDHTQIPEGQKKQDSSERLKFDDVRSKISTMNIEEMTKYWNQIREKHKMTESQELVLKKIFGARKSEINQSPELQQNFNSLPEFKE